MERGYVIRDGYKIYCLECNEPMEKREREIITIAEKILGELELARLSGIKLDYKSLISKYKKDNISEEDIYIAVSRIMVRRSRIV